MADDQQQQQQQVTIRYQNEHLSVPVPPSGTLNHLKRKIEELTGVVHHLEHHTYAWCRIRRACPASKAFGARAKPRGGCPAPSRYQKAHAHQCSTAHGTCAATKGPKVVVLWCCGVGGSQQCVAPMAVDTGVACSSKLVLLSRVLAPVAVDTSVGSSMRVLLSLHDVCCCVIHALLTITRLLLCHACVAHHYSSAAVLLQQ